ncbi:MAG: hypothetical protein ACTS27_07605 [Phycisphaerales bacterium]
MRIGQILVIGVIALTTTTQTGWGQDGSSPRVSELETEIRQLLQKNAALVQRLEQEGVDVRNFHKAPQRFLDLAFPGGDLSGLVKQIKEINARANIMLGEGTGDLKIPAFEAFEVTPAGVIWVAKGVVGADWNLEIDTIDLNDGSAPTTIVRAARDDARDRRLSSMAPSQAWNLTRWVGDDPERIDATFAAIQVGLETFDSNEITLKFHQPTGVLMARGSQAQINFIDSILVAASEMPMQRDIVQYNVAQAQSVIDRSSQRLAEIEGEAAILAAKADVVDARIIRLTEDKVGEETIATQRVERAEILARLTKLRYEEETLRAAVENAKKTVAEHEAQADH